MLMKNISAKTPVHKNQPSTLYEKVAGTLQAQIKNGVLRVGDRIPSVRALSKSQGVSVATILQSYMVLEQRGFIEASPKSGFYVRSIVENLPPQPQMRTLVPESATVRINDLVYEVIQAARDPSITQLGTSGPNPHHFPTKRLNSILRSVVRDFPHHSDRYDYPPGSEELRRQIARRSAKVDCLLTPSDLIITNGAIEALNLSLKAVAAPGDAIAVESPTYFCILQLLESMGMKAVEIPTDPVSGVNLVTLEEAIKRQNIRAGVFMANFNNPIGSLMPESTKEALVDLFAKRNIPIIEDDVNAELYHTGEQPKPLKAYDKKGLVLWCSSFTKTISPGFRVGWVAPGRYRESLEKLKFISSMASPGLTALVTARYLASGTYDRHLGPIRRAYAIQLERLQQVILKHFPKNTKVTRPKGGFLLWLEFSERFDSLKLYRKALSQKISILPGHLFSPSERYSNCIRLNCGNVWTDRIEIALGALGNLAKELSG